MDSDEQFRQLARRDTEITELAARGRRRTIAIMVFIFLPPPFVVMMLNTDASLASMIPIGLVCVGGLSYSWAKWARHPEDAQSVAFLGLERGRRGGAYRSVWHAKAIKDPVVLTIVESIDDHLHRSLWAVATGVVAVAVMAIALIAGSRNGHAWVVSIVVGLGAAVFLSGHRWLIGRIGVVLQRSRMTLSMAITRTLERRPSTDRQPRAGVSLNVFEASSSRPDRRSRGVNQMQEGLASEGCAAVSPETDRLTPSKDAVIRCGWRPAPRSSGPSRRGAA